jgi:hypothetical protein
MKEELVTDASLRQYLLGSVDDEERQRIESLVITNALSKERVFVAEEDLLDDYLEDALAHSDKERFLAQYAYTRERQHQLQISRDIRNWAIAQQERIVTSRAEISRRSRLFAQFRLKPILMVPIAVAAVIAIIGVILWLNRKMELRNRQFAVEQEIVRLNASTSNTDAQVSSLTLRPITLRSVAPQTDLVIRPEVQIVELRLLWNENESYPIYEARLTRIGGVQSFTIRNLHSEPDGMAIRLRLPSHILTIGTYHLELIGVAADGRIGPIEEFQFSVTG